VISERFFEHPGVPGGDADFGVFERRTRHDELGRPVEESCHGPDGRNVLCGTTGYHASLERYDDAGRLTERRALGVDRAPSDNLGTAIRQFEYDSYDHQAVARSLDAQGRPTDSYGLTTRRQLYDPGHAGRQSARRALPGSARARAGVRARALARARLGHEHEHVRAKEAAMGRAQRSGRERSGAGGRVQGR
jgi:hypothetical protein